MTGSEPVSSVSLLWPESSSAEPPADRVVDDGGTGCECLKYGKLSILNFEWENHKNDGANGTIKPSFYSEF